MQFSRFNHVLTILPSLISRHSVAFGKWICSVTPKLAEISSPMVAVPFFPCAVKRKPLVGSGKSYPIKAQPRPRAPNTIRLSSSTSPHKGFGVCMWVLTQRKWYSYGNNVLRNWPRRAGRPWASEPPIPTTRLPEISSSYQRDRTSGKGPWAIRRGLYA